MARRLRAIMRLIGDRRVVFVPKSAGIVPGVFSGAGKKSGLRGAGQEVRMERQGASVFSRGLFCNRDAVLPLRGGCLGV